MVEPRVDRLEGRFDVAEVHDPSGVFAGGAGHEQFHQKGMAVQARALVPVRHVRQTVGGFNVEFLVDFHAADCSNDRR